MSPTVCPSLEELSAFVLGALTEPELTEVAAHLDFCTRCKDQIEGLNDPVSKQIRRIWDAGEDTVSEPAEAAGPDGSGALTAVHEPWGDPFSARVVIEQLGSVAGPPTGQHTQTATSDGTAPQRLGEYRIIREVGRGGMGIVYEAVQESLGRRVALKVLPFQSLSDANHLERFRREAQAAAKLHHTNIVPVFGVGEHRGVHYFGMQFIEGQPLNSVLQELKARRRPGAPMWESQLSRQPGSTRKGTAWS